MNYGTRTEEKIQEVVDICKKRGERSIIALAGVPGTGKSFVASVAAQRITEEPLLVREVQFHPSFSYEEFVEGMRITEGGGVEVRPGVFLEWNQRALEDPDHTYVLLIEELTRANLTSVLGELLTFLEYRDRPYTAMYSRAPILIAKNLVVLATYNPADRSAVEIDGALLRRLRIVDFPPDTDQLEEMLGSHLPGQVIRQLRNLFDTCRANFGDDYEHLMPFGHGVFADVGDEGDLHPLWRQRLVRLLRRPMVDPHPFTDIIEASYPWRNPQFSVPSATVPAGIAAGTVGSSDEDGEG